MTTDLDDDGTSAISRAPSDDLASASDGLETGLDREARSGSTGQDRRLPRRSTALGFVVLGALSLAGALVVPDGQHVLFALAGVGGFAAVLTYALAPGRVIEARDGARVYETCSTNVTRLADELGATSERYYVPDTAADPPTARLFVPTTAAGDVPSVVSDDVGAGSSGLFLEPTGAAFFEEFDRTVADERATRPASLAEQLADALTERFELVGRADPVVYAGADRVVVALSDSAFGPVDRFDHPVVSFVAVALAVGLDRPIAPTITAETDRGEWLLICQWDADDSLDDAAE